jgi:hypothetical protein
MDMNFIMIGIGLSTILVIITICILFVNAYGTMYFTAQTNRMILGFMITGFIIMSAIALYSTIFLPFVILGFLVVSSILIVYANEFKWYHVFWAIPEHIANKHLR